MLSRRQTLMALAAGFASQVHAQRSASDYPNKPIKIIVPFPAGGGGDILARLTLSKLAQELGQGIVFENIGGAGGNVGVSNGSRAAADGYTLIYGTNGTHAINQTLYKNTGFDPIKDFEPITRLSRIAALLVVRPGLQVKTMKELLIELKKIRVNILSLPLATAPPRIWLGRRSRRKPGWLWFTFPTGAGQRPSPMSLPIASIS